MLTLILTYSLGFISCFGILFIVTILMSTLSHPENNIDIHVTGDSEK